MKRQHPRPIFLFTFSSKEVCEFGELRTKTLGKEENNILVIVKP